MPKVNFVKSAAKDNPVCKKGESYYWWKFRYGGKHYSLTPPKASQLTQSEFLSTLYNLQEQRDNLVSSFREGKDYDSFKSDVESLAEEFTTLGSECQDKFDNMPEGLQQGDVGQLLETRANKCEEIASELTDAAEGDGDYDETDPEGKIMIACPECSDESEFDHDFRGTHNCTECTKDFKVDDKMVEPILEEREQQREDFIENVASAVEGVDLDCE